MSYTKLCNFWWHKGFLWFFSVCEKFRVSQVKKKWPLSSHEEHFISSLLTLFFTNVLLLSCVEKKKTLNIHTQLLLWSWFTTMEIKQSMQECCGMACQCFEVRGSQSYLDTVWLEHCANVWFPKFLLVLLHPKKEMTVTMHPHTFVLRVHYTYIIMRRSWILKMQIIILRSYHQMIFMSKEVKDRISYL